MKLMSDVTQAFRELKPKYQRLAENVEQALKQFLKEHEIASFDVEQRVKDEKSFVDKVVRKSYDTPFEQVEDIAGVRVICYYNEDLDVIDGIIQEQFVVVSQSNKSEELSDDQFGYASNHYVVQLKQEWLQAPNYRGLENFKVEIQVRTILMHAWAAISHKLLYKKSDDVPKEFKRKLNRLSALIELADEEFDEIKNMKTEYQSSVVINESLPVNADSFMALMNNYFPGRQVNDSDISSVLAEIRQFSNNLTEFESRIKKCLPILQQMEAESYSEEELPVWYLSGVARTVLDLTSDEYWEKRDIPEPYASITAKYRSTI